MERYKMEIVDPEHGNQHTTMKKDLEGGWVKLKGNVMTASNVEVRGLNQIYLELHLKGKSYVHVVWLYNGMEQLSSQGCL